MKASSAPLVAALVLALANSVVAAEEPVPPVLPVEFFQKLESGKTQTVVLYGTSLTRSGTWSKEAPGYFENHYAGQVNVFNAAKNGMTSDWGVENLTDLVLSQNPDLVMMEFSANDAATKHGISLEKSRENLDAMVKAMREKNPQVGIVLQTMNPAWDSPRVPKSYGSERPELGKYYEVYRSYALENGLALIDHEPFWNRIRDEEPGRYQKMVPDGIHPSSTASSEVTWEGVKAFFEVARNIARGGRTLGLPVGATDTGEVWPEGKMPGKGAREPESLRPLKDDGFHRVTNISHPTLSFFPAKGEEARPIVIVCPGGGYGYLVIEKEGSEIARWLNTLGYSAAVLKYRAPHNRTGALQDIQRAILLVRANAEEWQADPTRVGVMGFSAGGHLCARAATCFDQPAYEGFDAVDGQSCRPDFAVLVYPAYLDDRNGGLSPDVNPAADLPPTLIVHNEDDRSFIAGTKLFLAALGKEKAPFHFLNYQTGGHGYALHCIREARFWPEAASAWLSAEASK